MKGVLKSGIRVPAVAEPFADISEGKAPGPGAKKGVEMKTNLRHARDAGREGDEGAHDGKHATEENGDRSPVLEVRGHAVKIVMTEKDETPVTDDERTSADSSDPVGDEGAEIAADGSGSGHEQQAEETVAAAEARGGDEIAGKRQDDFRWKRDAGRFDGHEQRDACVASDGDGGNDEMHQTGENLFGHNTLSIKVRPRSGRTKHVRDRGESIAWEPIERMRLCRKIRLYR